MNSDILNRSELHKFIKYCLVGGINTILTLGIIFIAKSLLGINPYISNIIGYIAGVCNSFMWNKRWVFHSSGGMRREAITFLCGFGICYALQFIIVWTLTQSSFGDNEYHLPVLTITGYGIATILGNIIYTIANFLYNRLITFKNCKKPQMS